MTKVNEILLENFRNFKSYKFEFNKSVNILFGNNGSGKTNILESISLLGKGRGFKNANILNLIYKNKGNFIICSEIEIDKSIFNIKISSDFFNNRYKKITSLNGETSNDAKDYLYSSLSFLYFLPEMERLFVSSPSYRRSFIDKLIFSDSNSYNKLINQYKLSITERSSYLKNNYFDKEWIEAIEDKISSIGLEIFDLRNKQIEILNESIKSINEKNNYPYKVVFHIKDDFFNSDLNKDRYLSILKSSRDVDSKFGGCKIGPHKSDIVAIINENVEASNLSTGQQKTLVLMTLIAQCNYLMIKKKKRPILLFDEVCSHLDDINRKILLDLINNFDIQSFFTGTEKSLFSFMSTNVKFYNITEL